MKLYKCKTKSSIHFMFIYGIVLRIITLFLIFIICPTMCQGMHDKFKSFLPLFKQSFIPITNGIERIKINKMNKETYRGLLVLMQPEGQGHGPDPGKCEDGGERRINNWVPDSQSHKVQWVSGCLCKICFHSPTLSQELS